MPYEHEFDMVVERGPRIVSIGSPVFSTPADEALAVNREGVGLVGPTLEKLPSLDSSTQNRIRLALRWYQQAWRRSWKRLWVVEGAGGAP